MANEPIIKYFEAFNNDDDDVKDDLWPFSSNKMSCLSLLAMFTFIPLVALAQC